MNTNLMALDAASPLGSLEAYISWVNRLPILDAAQEKELALSFKQNEDLDAARKLILSNLRFVIRIANSYKGYGLQQGDLIQEGNIGLMKAVKRFDPHMVVRLITFAVHWIKAEINEFVLCNWRVVRVATTKAQRKLFFNLRKAKSKLGWFSEKETKNVAQQLGVSTHDVQVMEERMLGGGDVAFSVCDSENDDEGVFSGAENYLADEHSDPMLLLTESHCVDKRKEKLAEAFLTLDQRSKDILEKRWFAEPKATLHELAAKYKISAERVRQVEQQAITKLKHLLQE